MMHQGRVKVIKAHLLLLLTRALILTDGQPVAPGRRTLPPENRYCCAALRVVQPGFRPNECRTVRDCEEREERQTEIVRLYGCTDPTQQRNYIIFPEARIKTDRLDGWFPFERTAAGGGGGTIGRKGGKWEWNVRTGTSVIEEPVGALRTPDEGLDTFFDGARVNAIFRLEGSDVFRVPNYIEMYTEPCRAYEPHRTTYQNVPGNRVYNFMDIYLYTDCAWLVHFSFAKDPYKVTRPYFNERDELEARETLEDPTSTQYFDEVVMESARGYFAFPYFLVVRMVCQDEGYYGEEFYYLAQSAASPLVNLGYTPPNSRSHFENPISLTMTPVLINLEQDELGVMVPEPDVAHDTLLMDRQFFSLGTNKRICYLNLCQPAFALPQPFLQIPILQVSIPDGRNVAEYEKNIYVNPFHARTASATGEIQVGRQFETAGPNVTSVHPRYFFPKQRFTQLDLDLDPENLHVCTVSEASRLRYEMDIPASFYLEGREAALDWIIQEMESTKKALPLTRDDFFAPQYTFGTAPVVAIAGFFQPNLVLLGDPEMDTINLIEWAFPPIPITDRDTRLFDANGSCLTAERYIKAIGAGLQELPLHQKPMYSRRQKDDVRRHIPGRRSYYPANYDVHSRRAIFEIINLDDRILLKTTSGLSTLYGNSNATKGVDKILKGPEGEKLRRCFKVISSLNVALADYDPLVAITYDYANWNRPEETHSQEIWYGKYSTAGQEIEWTEIGSKEYQGTLEPPIHIDPGVTTQETSMNISEAAKICSLVYTKHVLPLFPNEINRTAYRLTVEPDHHNCIVLDGTPKPSHPDVIQLLVEMTFTYYKDLECNPVSDNFAGLCEPLLMPKCLRYHYCVDLIAKKSRPGPTPAPTPSPPPPPTCPFIPAVDCPKLPCYPPKLAGCATSCSCPSCPAVTTCPPDHCHPSCALCPEIAYFPKRCDCPAVHDEATGAILPTCTGTECDPCPDDTTDCHSSPFGPCKPGVTLFCPKSVIANRKAPYCPRCMQNFQESLEGSYEYPVKAKVYLEDDNLTPNPSDLELCRTMVTGTTAADWCKFSVQDIKLFVIAQHTVGKPITGRNSWDIVSIFPQRPCTNPHFERILSIRALDESYFGESRLPLALRRTCFERFVTNAHNDLSMIRFTYTRQINNHLFIYGPKLMHSLDGGNTLVLMRDYPRLPPVFNSLDYDMSKVVRQHVITVMAFSNGGMYAFLTSKRELWLGTTGSIRQARLRPNDGWSMMGLRLYKDRMGVPEGIPFTVLFDSFDNLMELVALRDPEGHIDRIMKREVDLQLILRNNFFVQDLQKHVNEQLVLAYALQGNADFNAATVTPPLNTKEALFIHYDINELSLHCPFSQMSVIQNYSQTLNRLQRFHFNPPTQHFLLGIDHKPSSLMAYSVATFGMVYGAFLQKRTNEIYSNVRRDPIEKWRIGKTEEAYIGYIRYLKKDPRKTGIVVDPRESATRLTDAVNSSAVGTNWIRKFWIDYNQIVRLEIDFFIKNAQLLTKTDFLGQKLSEIQINVDNGDGEIVRLNTERRIIAKRASVKFIAHISLFENGNLKPSYPGLGLVPVPLTFHLIGGFGRCFRLEHWGMVGESLTTTVIAGCPPATGLLFDWNATLHSLRFRSKTEKYGFPEDCGEGEQVCFSIKESLTFNFDILDLSNQRYNPFVGKFKFQVVGGAHSREELQESGSRYTQNEIDAFNIPGKSDISLIWTIAPENNQTEVERDGETQESVLTAGLTQIRFVCNTLSPCARISPRLDLQTNFYFLVRITNAGVDTETLCIHEREFVIMMYGFTPGPEVQLLLTLFICLLIITLMYIFFLCCRRHRKVWRANKLRLTGWIRIIVDTFPKSIKQSTNSVEAHRKRDSIILSLQGHLNVPDIVTRSEAPKENPDELDSDEGSSEEKLSKQSLESEGSETSLPRVRARKKGATWTDMVYEAIISQRLLAIVNRNRRMREHVLQTPIPPPEAADMEPVMEQESARSLPVEFMQGRKSEGKKGV